MHLTKSDLESTERIKRLNIINSISGIKPGNLIGTTNGKGLSNLAIFSSVIHLGSNPALLGFIMRPQGDVPRHTYENILATGVYTINHVGVDFAEKAHYTASKYETGISEFDRCGLNEEYKDGFKAPYVGESSIKMGMKHLESIPIEINGTTLVIGSVEHLYMPENTVSPEGYVDLAAAKTAGVGGLNTYYKIEQLDTFPFARPGENPFDK